MPAHTAKTVSNLRGTQALRRLRIAYYVFHFVTIGIGLLLIGVSVDAQLDENHTIHILDLHITRGIAIVAYVAGGGAVTSGIIGCAALFLDKKPYLWVIYCILMAILTLIAFAGAVSSGNQRSAIVKKEMYKLIGDYQSTSGNRGSGSLGATKKVDTFQTQFKCCGVEKYSDWQDVEYGRTSLKVPVSCCRNRTANGSPIDPFCGDLCLPDHPLLSITIYEDGCFQKMTGSLDIKIIWLTVVGAILSTLALILFVLSCYLVISKKA